MVELESEVRLLRSQITDERTRRETLGSEHMQLIA